MNKFKEYKNIDFPKIDREIRKYWEDQEIFNKSIENREGDPSFTFYEGPPSANGTRDDTY